MEQLSLLSQLIGLCSRARKPQLLRLLCPGTHAAQNGTPPPRESCTPQLLSSPQSSKDPEQESNFNVQGKQFFKAELFLLFVHGWNHCLN